MLHRVVRCGERKGEAQRHARLPRAQGPEERDHLRAPEAGPGGPRPRGATRRTIVPQLGTPPGGGLPIGQPMQSHEEISGA